MNILNKLFILLSLIFSVSAFSAKSTEGEVDCENIGSNKKAKETCQKCGYVYDSKGVVIKNPSNESVDEGTGSGSGTTGR